MADLLAEVHHMRTDNSRHFASLDQRLASLESQQKKTNLGLSEVRLSVMRLAHTMEKYSDHEKRIKKLEKAAFNGH